MQVVRLKILNSPPLSLPTVGNKEIGTRVYNKWRRMVGGGVRGRTSSAANTSICYSKPAVATWLNLSPELITSYVSTGTCEIPLGIYFAVKCREKSISGGLLYVDCYCCCFVYEETGPWGFWCSLMISQQSALIDQVARLFDVIWFVVLTLSISLFLFDFSSACWYVVLCYLQTGQAVAHRLFPRGCRYMP